MRRSARGIAAVLALALVGPLGGSAWSAPGAGYSTPVEDSYYPAHGDPGIDVLSYSLNLRWLRNDRELRGRATVKARSTGNAAVLRLALADALTVTAVKIDGTPTSGYTHTGGQLRITGPWTADQLTTLTVRYRGTPHAVKAPTTRSDLRTIGWHTTRSGDVWTMQEPFGAFTWYPVNDTPSDKAVYRVTVNTPSAQTGVFNGRMVSRRTQGHRQITVFRPPHPIASYLTTIAIAPLKQVRTKAWDGTPITYWIPKKHPEYARALAKTPGDFRWLVNTLGPYPYDRVGIVIVPSASAMETPELITFGEGVLRYGNRSVREVVVHELAHAWFGDTATPTDWRDVWLNEGPAMYFQMKFAVHSGWRTWKSVVRDWKASDQYWRNSYGPPGAYDKDAFAEGNVYYCPARMLDRLSTKVGDTSFRRGMRKWVAVHLDDNVSREEFETFWESRSGLDLTSFFDRWLNSTTSPR